MKKYLFLALAFLLVANVAYAQLGRCSHCAADVAVEAPKTCNTFLFDGTKSFDPDKDSISYLWDFGDGTTSTAPVVRHVYEKAGTYAVTLTVKDTSGLKCDTSVSTETVTVGETKAVLSGPNKVCLGDSVNFDASASTVNRTGSETYAWDFGDGSTGTGSSVSHAYQKGGTYKVKLTVNDNLKTACSVDSTGATVSVNSAPVADAGKDISLCLPARSSYTVHFNGSGSSDPDGDSLAYTWDFGDGSTGTGATTSHTYSAGGTYRVTLTVDDGKGLACSLSQDSLTVALNKKPTADAGPNTVCCVGDTATFDGSASSHPDRGALSYAWDFGDGATATGKKVTHAYNKSGSYIVTLTVDDNKGTDCSKDSSSFRAVVNERPTSVIKIK